MFENHLIAPDTVLNLYNMGPEDRGSWKDKKEKARVKLSEFTHSLDELQELLYAESKQKVLIVLQGMDTSGKDGTIRAVFEGVNPQGVKVASFKVPTPIERSHDFLWRIHPHIPGQGENCHFQPVSLRGRAGRTGAWVD